MKVKILITFALCFCPFIFHGQIAEEIERIDSDSLQQALSTLTGSEKIDTLNAIAYRINLDFPDSCKKLAGQAIILSDSLNYHKGLADGYRRLGIHYLIEDSLFLAMINLLNAERIYEQIDPSLGLALSYTYIAFINFFTGRPQSRINYERKAINVLKQIDSTGRIAMRYNHIASGYMELGEYDSAIYNNKLAISHADSSINPWFYNTFGRIYLRQFYESGDTILLAKSIEWFKKGLNSPEINDYQNAGINANLFHAYYAYENKEMDNLALDHLNQIIPNAVKSKEAFYTIPGSWLKRGKLSKRGLRFDSAIIYYNKSLNIIDSALSNFSTSGFIESFSVLREKHWLKIKKSEAYYLLYEVYSTTGDYRKALENYINYKNASEEIYEEDTKNLVAMLEAESENEKTQSQIAIFERDKRNNELKAAQTRNLNISIVVVFVILLLLGILFLRQNKLKNEQKSTLLEQRLLRLQMNPHFIFNALSSIHSLMNPKDVNRASDYLGSFSRLLRSSLESSREEYILLEDEISSMKNYMDLQRLRYDEKFDYKINVDRAIDLNAAIIPPMLIQPFIENAIEHGIKHKEEPGNIHIRFKLDDKKISCEIEDNGIGREKAWDVEYAKKGKHKSLATEIIRDRIKILNKKLKHKINLIIIDKHSETEQPLGTMVRLDLPYILD
jgi:tetratricopeptide (TPR) repeat protein